MALDEPPGRAEIADPGKTVNRNWLQWFSDLKKAYNNLISGIIASRLVAADADSNLEGVDDLTDWIAGTSGEITVTDDADGTVTLSLAPDYAEIYINGNVTAKTLTVQNTWYQYLFFDTNGQYSGATPDNTEDHITIGKTGIYIVVASLSFSGTASSTYEIQIQKNNGVTALTNLHLERALGSAGDIGSTSISGLASLTAADTIEVWMRCTSGAGKAITIRDGNLSVVRIT